MPGFFEKCGTTLETGPLTWLGKGLDTVGELNRMNFENNVSRLESKGVSKTTAIDVSFDNWIGTGGMP